MSGLVRITSFGYLHGDPPVAHLTVDLRQHFRDPHVSPKLRHMTANDPAVRQAVLNTPGIPALVEAIADVVVAYLHGPGRQAVNVAAGCAGGRHRAAVVAAAVQAALEDENLTATVVHRDLDKPVIDR